MGVGVQRDANIRVAHEVLRRLGVHGALCMLEQNVCLQTWGVTLGICTFM
jgi:hypothetical protein